MQKYSSDTNTEFNLNDYYDKTTMVTAVGNIAYTGGTTNTGKDALDARFIKKNLKQEWLLRAQKLCEGRGGRPGLPSLIRLRFFVDVKQHFNKSNC